MILHAAEKLLPVKNELQMSAIMDSTLANIVRVYHPFIKDPLILGFDRDMDGERDKV